MNLQALTGCRKEESDKFSNHLLSAMRDMQIESPLRMAAFLAQVAHESGLFRTLEENLNYSAKGLRATFGKYFLEGEEKEFERKPEKIANRVYANRMGNGDEKSGDGWSFRGHGLIHLTGKSNYAEYDHTVRLGLVDCPDLLLEPVNAANSAVWFWNKKGLNPLADRGEFEKITRAINGGLNGFSERIKIYERAKLVLGA